MYWIGNKTSKPYKGNWGACRLMKNMAKCAQTKDKGFCVMSFDGSASEIEFLNIPENNLKDIKQ